MIAPLLVDWEWRLHRQIWLVKSPPRSTDRDLLIGPLLDRLKIRIVGPWRLIEWWISNFAFLSFLFYGIQVSLDAFVFHFLRSNTYESLISNFIQVKLLSFYRRHRLIVQARYRKLDAWVLTQNGIIQRLSNLFLNNFGLIPRKRPVEKLASLVIDWPSFLKNRDFGCLELRVNFQVFLSLILQRPIRRRSKLEFPIGISHLWRHRLVSEFKVLKVAFRNL